MPVIELVYETHATTTDNEAGIATGWLPGRLSAEGWEQARELGRRRADDGIAAVFSSDLKRAVDTANIAFGASGLELFLDWRLRECDYGELNGAHVKRLDRAAHIATPFSGGESYRDVVIRTESFLADLRARWDGTRVCIVAHSANRWALQHLLEGTPLEQLVDAPFEWREGWEYRLP
jgi:alpha-ribazole phosphatase/probable phosphoglycerate mutase